MSITAMGPLKELRDEAGNYCIRDGQGYLVIDQRLPYYVQPAFLTFQRRLGASNFIVKNGNADDLRRDVTYSLEQAVDAIAKYRYIQKNTFSYGFGHDVRNMSMGDVVYVETTPVPHKLRLVKTTGWAEFIGKLKELPEKYPALVQVSESCVINPANVKEVDLKEKKLTFITGDVQYFSVRNSRKVRQLFQER